jgi:hypothetical protein
MDVGKGQQTLFQRELAKAEVIADLRHALDLQYRLLVESARADWERCFGSDPSDECVTVRVTVDQPAAIPGSAFLKSRRPASESHGKSSMPRLAH